MRIYPIGVRYPYSTDSIYELTNEGQKAGQEPIRIYSTTASNFGVKHTTECPSCGGTGNDEENSDDGGKCTCQTCKGTGKIKDLALYYSAPDFEVKPTHGNLKDAMKPVTTIVDDPHDGAKGVSLV